VSQDVTTQLRQMNFPFEYRAQVVGDAVPRASTQTWILTAALVVAAVAYLLLQSATSSWRGAAVLFLTVPFAAAGGLLGALFTGRVLDGGVLVALFVAVALALRQSLVLVRRAQALLAEHGQAEAMRLAVRESTPSVLIVALGTAALFLPPVVMGSEAGLELLHPFAVSLLCGLVSVVAVVLLVVPNLYPTLAGVRPLPPPPDEEADETAPPDGASAVPRPRTAPNHADSTEAPDGAHHPAVHASTTSSDAPVVREEQS
jgi:multidrug efflux pump subunit AcrB